MGGVIHVMVVVWQLVELRSALTEYGAVLSSNDVSQVS